MTLINYDDILDKARKLPLTEQLRLMKALALSVETKAAESEPESILSLEGLGKELWAHVDAEVYIREERASWDG